MFAVGAVVLHEAARELFEHHSAQVAAQTFRVPTLATDLQQETVADVRAAAEAQLAVELNEKTSLADSQPSSSDCRCRLECGQIRTARSRYCALVAPTNANACCLAALVFAIGLVATDD